MKKKVHDFFYYLFLWPSVAILLFSLSTLFYVCKQPLIFKSVLFVSIFITALLGSKMLEKKINFRTPFYSLILISFLGIIFLSSQNCTRCYAPGAAIKQSLSNMRSQAHLFYDTNGSYENVCIDSNVSALKESILSNGKTVERPTCLGPVAKLFDPKFTEKMESYFNCNDSPGAYAAEAYLPHEERFACVDSKDTFVFSERSIGDALKCE